MTAKHLSESAYLQYELRKWVNHRFDWARKRGGARQRFDKHLRELFEAAKQELEWEEHQYGENVEKVVHRGPAEGTLEFRGLFQRKEEIMHAR